jgi:exodeoxyribonuclease V
VLSSNTKITLRQRWEAHRDCGSITSVRLPSYVLRRVQDPTVVIDNPAPDLQLEAEQRAVLDDVIDWVIHPDDHDRVLTIGGYAGSGKTTVIRYIQAYLNAVRICHAITSLTGKAVLVLKSKGIHGALTMHSLLYHVDESARKISGELKFIKNKHLRESIVIVDEGQILSQTALDDFLSFPQVRVILVGDPGQLKPVGGKSIFLMERPRLQLHEVRRQALGSNILKVAHAVRQGLIPTYGQAPGVLIAPKSRFFQDMGDSNIDQIIVGFNSTRHCVNKLIRKMRGLTGEIPQAGDKVICLNNNPHLGLYNGQIFKVIDASVIKNTDDELIQMDLVEGNQTYHNVIAIADQFGRNKMDYSVANNFRIHGYDNLNFFDYANAISCHKALGSQWDSVAVLEQFHNDWEGRRWIYSSMTRPVHDLKYYR